MTQADPSTPAPVSSGAPAPKRSLMQRLGPAGLLGVLWALLPAVGGILLLARIDHASDWLQSHDLGTALLVYISIFVVSAGVGVLPTYAQSILAGWVFQWIGIPAALAGFGGASLLGYAIARFVSRDRVEKVIAENVKAKAVRDSLVGSGFWRSLLIVSLVRLPPNSPFALTNGVMAASGVKLLPYFLGTVIGMTPRTTAAVILAVKLAHENQGGIGAAIGQRGIGYIAFLIVTVMIALAVIGSLANRAIAKVTAQGAASSTAAEAP